MKSFYDHPVYVKMHPFCESQGIRTRFILCGLNTTYYLNYQALAVKWQKALENALWPLCDKHNVHPRVAACHMYPDECVDIVVGKKQIREDVVAWAAKCHPGTRIENLTLSQPADPLIGRPPFDLLEVIAIAPTLLIGGER